MKIDELKRIAKENEYTIKKYDEFKVYKLVRKVGEYNVVVNSISIDADIRNLLFLNTIYCDEKDLNMIKAAIKFAETPIDEREEKKKFYLRHKWIFDKDFYIYLRKTSYDDKEMSLGVINFRGNDGLQFTLEEIEKIKEKFDTDLKDFELVEVEE